MLLTTAQDLSPCTLFLTNISLNSNHTTNSLILRTRATFFSPLSLLRSITLFQHRHIRSFSAFGPSSSDIPPSEYKCCSLSRFRRFSFSAPPLSTFVEQGADVEDNWDSARNSEADVFDFDKSFSDIDLKHLSSPPFEVKELVELPEQWRRSKIAWLCKELPAHKVATLVRILNAQRKWITQEDATYVAIHCMRIRENEAGFKVYKWMMQQHWFRFDFALATKLADYMGKERKFSKCREIFDDIINQGRVPPESTFHILIIAYLSAPVHGCLEEACSIYNRMIQLGGYQPRLSLHNSLFRALVSKPGGSSKHYLKQAEFIFHNLVTCGLEIHKDIYGGLIWLHSYQDSIDKERITHLRNEMQRAGIEEGREVLVSIMRASSKVGDVKEAERAWLKLLQFDSALPSQAFVYKMEVYAKAGDSLKSLDIFKEMQKILGSTAVVAYHKIIEVLCKAQEIELAETLMKEFIESGRKPLMPSFIDLMNMYFGLSLHDKLESTFFQCLEKCRPNRTIYNIYLDSLVQSGNLVKAEEVFNQMYSNEAIGVNTRSCNTILSGYLSSGDEYVVKAEKIYDFMCAKKYDIESPLVEKLDYVLSLNRKVVKKPTRLKLSIEQREILVGLLLGGILMESDENRKNHVICFEFKEKYESHSVLKRHIYDQFHEWLHISCKSSNDNDDIPYRFFTIPHISFGYYGDQFWPKGKLMIPKLIHRWLSPRTLAYWYMYAGHRTSSGDIVLKLKGSNEGIEKVVKALKSKSLDCKVKRKGRVCWIGFLGKDSTWFWKMTEPYILDELKDVLKVGEVTSENEMVEGFSSESDSDEKASFALQ